MRAIEIQVRTGDVDTVRRLAETHGERTPAVLEVARGDDRGWRHVHAELPNDRVGALVDAVADRVDDVRFVLSPGGILPVRKPLGDLRAHVADVSRRSTLELVLDALQSIGSWRGMLLYALISGLVAAYGVIFDVPYLLTASMLIAPMGAPAMVTVIGVALGDLTMVRRGSLRFFVALGVAVAAAVALGLAYGLQTVTPTMELVSSLSGWAFLLAVAGGAAGAQALVRSDRDSLVTATATGFLVAVALSPPAAVLGLAVAMGRVEFAGIMGFNLLLTFFGIVAGGWLSLRIFGVRPADATGGRGRTGPSVALVAAAITCTAALAGWQHAAGPELRKADVKRQAERLTREAVVALPGYRLLETRAEFVREPAEWLEAKGLVVRVVLHPVDESAGLRPGRVRSEIAGILRSGIPDVQPFVDVVTVPAEAGPVRDAFPGVAPGPEGGGSDPPGPG